MEEAGGRTNNCSFLLPPTSFLLVPEGHDMLMQTLDDAAVIALLPGLVLMLRRTGLPARLETAAMVTGGVLLVCLVDLAGGLTEITTATAAGWILTGLIDGLAAAGLTRLTPPRATPPGQPAAGDEHRPNRGLR